MKRKIFGILCIIFIFLSLKIGMQSFYLPVGFWHMMHLFLPPKDLYENIVEDKFLFWEDDFSKTYNIIPVHSDFYDLGFICKKDYLPSTYKFSGKIKVEFFYKKDLLFEKTVTSWKTAGYVKGNSNYFSKVALLHFKIPLKNKYKKDIRAKLTVIEADEFLKQFQDSVKLFIGVSPTP